MQCRILFDDRNEKHRVQTKHCKQCLKTMRHNALFCAKNYDCNIENFIDERLNKENSYVTLSKINHCRSDSVDPLQH